MNLEIPQSDFVAWKKDPTTKFVFSYLQEIANSYKEYMVSGELISSPTGHLKLNHLRGYVDAIEEILNLEALTIEDAYEEITESPGQ